MIIDYNLKEKNRCNFIVENSYDSQLLDEEGLIMSRRVITESDIAESRKTKGIVPGGQAEEKPDATSERIAKYIPTEVVSVYVAIDSIIKAAGETSNTFFFGIFLILTIATPLYMWRVTDEPGKPHAYTQIIVATIAFILWVFALGGPFSNFAWYKPYQAAVILALYTLFVPIIIGRKV